MEKRGGCDRAGVAIPVQMRQRFKPCCPVFAVLEDCADCSGCSPLRVVVLARKERILCGAEFKYSQRERLGGCAKLHVEALHDRTPPRPSAMSIDSNNMDSLFTPGTVPVFLHRPCNLSIDSMCSSACMLHVVIRSPAASSSSLTPNAFELCTIKGILGT